MKTRIIISAAVLSVFVLLTSGVQKEKMLKQALVLKVPEGLGRNGAGVAYNPTKKMYYTSFAGNPSYTISVFDQKGVLLKGNVRADFDIRGFWYHTKLNRLEGNSHGVTNGYYFRNLLSSGMIDTNSNVANSIWNDEDNWDENEFQPDDNSVGVFVPKTNEVVFRLDLGLTFYSHDSGRYKRSARIKNFSGDSTHISDYAFIYTGIKKMEFGMLDYVSKKILLVNASNCTITKTISLPADAPTDVRFNFAYCNGMYWLFDKSNRQWIGYK